MVVILQVAVPTGARSKGPVEGGTAELEYPKLLLKRGGRIVEFFDLEWGKSIAWLQK